MSGKKEISSKGIGVWSGIVKAFSSCCWKDMKPSVKYTAIYANKGKFELAFIDDDVYFYNYERIRPKTKLTPYQKRCQLA